MRDFTVAKYCELLQTLKECGYEFITFEKYCEGGKLPGKFVMMRHDVDKLPKNAERIGEVEARLGIQSSFYFRIVNNEIQDNSIRTIVKQGHEVGYHYEDVALCKGDVEKARESFTANLQYFREFYPVKTVCMHGSPTSRFDNRELWKSWDYRELGVTGEPYFDVDFEKVFYLTDTGRCWDGEKYSVRDKVSQQDRWKKEGLSFHGTDEVLEAVRSGRFPKQVMMTTHPQRWCDDDCMWWRELVLQSVKNVVKRLLIRI